MSDYIPYEVLPFELVIEILARLPVVSLLRFKSVCKSWYSLIKSTSFVTKHLNHRKNKHIGIYYRDYQKERYFICRDDDQCGREYSELEFPYKTPSADFMIAGSCNGLLCMWEDSSWDKSTIIVWNPSMRKLVTLPKPPLARMCVLGFGAHPTTHEYKVVRIVCQTYPYQHELQPYVELYTQGTGSWRGLGSTFPLHCFIDITHEASQAFVSGAVNWIAEDPRVSVGYRRLIVSFDMSTETFSVMILPPALADRERRSLSVTLFRESLAMLCGQQRDKDDCCIWVMKEYGVPESWTKLFSFRLDWPVYPKRTLGFMKHNEVLVSTIDNRLLSYDIGTKALVDTGIRGDPSSFHFEPFVESLVLVENKNGVVDGQLNPL
ncbi:hypothetical protein RHMOL_Rhmol04G0093100 [Rhododendron molle]|uniref:Uncharacterized protein n=1 Tax=Rhododendron molle TaxID=49168 RepID=A0ACC0NZR3_RHOML|nr:hypothetical protein RHMOL_Rhmol04G0093100 [Rhododendron molle]